MLSRYKESPLPKTSLVKNNQPKYKIVCPKHLKSKYAKHHMIIFVSAVLDTNTGKGAISVFMTFSNLRFKDPPGSVANKNP